VIHVRESSLSSAPKPAWGPESGLARVEGEILSTEFPLHAYGSQALQHFRFFSADATAATRLTGPESWGGGDLVQPAAITQTATGAGQFDGTNTPGQGFLQQGREARC